MIGRVVSIACAVVSVAMLHPPSAAIAQNTLRMPSPKRIYADRYPLLAHLANIEGEVKLVATVSPQGTVQSVLVASGAGLLAGPAEAMLSKWIFEPCEAVGNCESNVIFRFVLEAGTCGKTECPAEVQVDLPATVTIRSKHRSAIVN